MPEKIETVQDLKAQYPELCKELLNAGAALGFDMMEDFLKKAITQTCSDLHFLSLKFCAEVGESLAKAFEDKGRYCANLTKDKDNCSGSGVVQ